MVSERLFNGSLVWYWRRPIRSGAEYQQLTDLQALIGQFHLSEAPDTWTCSLSSNGNFSVSAIRKLLDTDNMGAWPTHWCKVVPPKVNFFLWRLRLDRLPDMCNLLDRGIDTSSLLCYSCRIQVEDINHVFFSCDVAEQVWSFIARWLDVNLPKWQCFEDMWQWVMLSSQNAAKVLITEVVCYASLWTLWRFRNGLIFNPGSFKKSHVIDTIVLYSFDWLSSRYKKANLNWNVWLQFPLMSLGICVCNEGYTLKLPSGFHGQSVRYPGVAAIDEFRRERMQEDAFYVYTALF
ncbi:uncharacterized protein [Rutidosis leptorrhynchoides]|uniref:uncharacterized protein n=1 Tax=Rutidosis leptorrhynchoides TaxID=125765 RepID=UPI003A999869